MAGWSAGVAGAEWSLTPNVRDTLLYDDNRRLTLADHEAVWGNLLRADADFAWRSERTRVSLRPGMEVRRFSAEKEILDRDDESLAATFSHVSERTSLELSADLAYRGSLTTDLEAAERTNVNSETRDRTLAATWSYALTPRNSVQLSGSYSDIDYELERTTGLSSYRFASVSATGLHQWSAKDQLSLSVFESRFDSPRATSTFNGVSTTQESRITTVGFQLGWSRAVSETLSGSLSVGARTSRTEARTVQRSVNGVVLNPGGADIRVVDNAAGADLTGDVLQVPRESLITSPVFGPLVAFPGDFFAAGATIPAAQVVVPPGTDILLLDQEVDESNRGLALNGSLEQDLESWSWRIDASRSLTPQSNGNLRERDNLDFRITRPFSPRLRGTLNGRYYTDSALGDDGGDSQRTFTRLSGELRWRLDRHWSLAGRYQYRRNENQNDDVAQSNAVLFTLSYNGDKTAWSR